MLQYIYAISTGLPEMYLCSLEFRWQVSFPPILWCFPFICLLPLVYFSPPLFSYSNLLLLSVATVYPHPFYHSSSTSSFTHTSLRRGRLNKTDLCWQSILETNVAKQQVTLLMPSYSSLFAVTVEWGRGTVDDFSQNFMMIIVTWQTICELTAT